jgi:outer membrane protein assembly factor BamD (BamD/ComL family)
LKPIKLVLISSFFFLQLIFAQDAELKSIEEVISGIDSLLEEIDNSSNSESQATDIKNDALQKDSLDNSRSYRLENELLPKELRNPINEIPVEAVGEPSFLQPSPDLITPTSIRNSPQPATLPRNVDYSKLSLDDLLREVDMLRKPALSSGGTRVESLPSVPKIQAPEESPKLLLPTKDYAQGTPADFQPVIIPSSTQTEPEGESEIFVEDYIVLGEEIDQEMKEKIREAIMSTRMASGGTGNPFVTRTVYKATSYCNRVLGRLNGPNYKRYRRDILLAMINMHEKNQAWVDAAKSYERFLEEFASDDDYPFQQHEDAPGIPDLHAQVGSVEDFIQGLKRGAPTIPETHIRAGKIYRELGADRMALNKFYDAINATLTLPYNVAFTDAEKRKGKSFEQRKDAESNQAMFEIAETFLASEDYDNAIKFYDRLNRLEQLNESDRSVVAYKRGLAHFRRATDTLRKEDREKRLNPESDRLSNQSYEKTPRADFARVKEILRGYGTLYPTSPYVPETHYLLALAFEQLNQSEESIGQLLSLLKEATFNPRAIMAEEDVKNLRDRDLNRISKMKTIWNFWKKKTGNYLANKFFETGEFFNAYRIYSALLPVDETPTWRVPLLYQVALCEEKLGNFVQATETYISIEGLFDNNEGARTELAQSKYLKFVYGMSKWRREQLEDTREIRQAVNRYGIYSPPPGEANIDNSF